MAPKQSLVGTKWCEASTDFHPQLNNMSEATKARGFLFPTPGPGFRHWNLRPCSSPKAIRLARHAPQKITYVRGAQSHLVVLPTFRATAPALAYEQGIDAERRKVMADWGNEQKANIYTRNRRRVTTDIWKELYDHWVKEGHDKGHMATTYPGSPCGKGTGVDPPPRPIPKPKPAPQQQPKPEPRTVLAINTPRVTTRGEAHPPFSIRDWHRRLGSHIAAIGQKSRGHLPAERPGNSEVHVHLSSQRLEVGAMNESQPGYAWEPRRGALYSVALPHPPHMLGRRRKVCKNDEKDTTMPEGLALFAPMKWYLEQLRWAPRARDAGAPPAANVHPSLRRSMALRSPHGAHWDSHPATTRSTLLGSRQAGRDPLPGQDFAGRCRKRV